MSNASVQQQFGAHANAYATSRVHAQGASLQRLVELVQPRPQWRMLDIATGAGHTAFTFAPHVNHVTASDLTPEMLVVTARLAAEKGIVNLTTQLADAANLPFEAARFELVTCRIAPHHFPDIDRFLCEAQRVLTPGGLLALVDNIVPAGAAGAYVNAFEQLRDPSHVRCLTLEEWQDALARLGYSVLATERAAKAMEFDDWAGRMGATGDTVATLRALLCDATGDAASFLTPRLEEGALWFNLEEAIVIARAPA